MGRRGPKPKTPDQLRVIGSHAPKRKPSNPVTGTPTCPRHLSLAAKRYWKQIVSPLIGGGWVGQLDTQALARYCVLLARLDECQRGIDEHGIVIIAPTGQHKTSQYVAIHRETSLLLIQLEKELGLTPYSRRTLTPTNEQPAEEPSAKYFG